MALVETKELNALAQRLRDLLTTCTPDQVRQVVVSLNSDLSDFGIVLKHVDELAAGATKDLQDLDALIADGRSAITDIQSAVRAFSALAQSKSITITFNKE